MCKVRSELRSRTNFWQTFYARFPACCLVSLGYVSCLFMTSGFFSVLGPQEGSGRDPKYSPISYKCSMFSSLTYFSFSLILRRANFAWGSDPHARTFSSKISGLTNALTAKCLYICMILTSDLVNLMLKFERGPSLELLLPKRIER